MNLVDGVTCVWGFMMGEIALGEARLLAVLGRSRRARSIAFEGGYVAAFMKASAHFGAVAELAAACHGVFTRREAVHIGVPSSAIASMIDRGVIDEPLPGVLRWLAAPATWRQQVAVASATRGRCGLAIGTSGARLHVMDGSVDLALVHVALPRGGRLDPLAAKVSQTLASYTPEDIIVIDGIRTTSLARTVCDIAWHAPALLTRVADDFQRRGASLRWLEHVALRLQQRGTPGAGRMLRDLELRMTGGRVPDSWFERLVEECLTSTRLPKAVRQFTIRDSTGQFVARVDLGFPDVKLAVEAHSRQWHTGPTREAFDQRRDTRLSELGWQVHYIGWADSSRSPRATRQSLERIAMRRQADLRRAS